MTLAQELTKLLRPIIREATGQITRAIDRNTRAQLRIADMMADHVYRGGADFMEERRGIAHRGVTAEIKRLEEDR